MNLATVVLLSVVATIAAAGAIAAGTNTTLAIPVAAVAVGAAAFLLVGVLERTVWSSPGTRSSARTPMTGVRAALGSGKPGRRELISLLDSLERSSYASGPLPLSTEELNHLLSENPEEFRRYLDARVHELEGRT
jgi:hypothetical protein